MVALWGASSTHFIEPTGLAPENVSSSFDYAIISKEVLKNPIIAKASTMPEYIFYTLNTKIKHRLRNTDHIINTNEFKVTGSKTGYLDEALYCLMIRVKEGTNTIIVVTMGADSRTESFEQTSDLLRYGLRLAED
jgi:D-alanyl-D-alanine carboxypeptidase